MSKFIRLATLMCASVCLSMIVGCSEEEVVTPTADYTGILSDLTNNVVVATYTELDSRAATLLATVNALQLDKTAANLLAAKQAWIDAREPWEQSEGFLFGPVDTEGIDPALDSWPVNQVDLENVLAGGDDLNNSFVNALEGTLKGFHTIEFLLFGADGQKTVDMFNDREFEYLISTTQVLAADASLLATAWQTTGQNFSNNIISAGNTNSIYISQKAALEEFANGILGITDEVGNGKLNDPLEQEDFSLEESQFSDNSKTDFTNNIRSIRNIYEGRNGMGLSTIVAELDPELDTRIKSEIEASINAIQNIPGTFTAAIPANSPTRPAAENAQATVRTLQTTFEERLIPLISNL